MPLILPLAAVAIGLLCVLLVWGTGYLIRLLTNWNVGWAPIRWVIRASLALPVTLLQGMENLILPALHPMEQFFGNMEKAAATFVEGVVNYVLHLNDKTNQVHKSVQNAQATANAGYNAKALKTEVASAQALARQAANSATAVSNGLHHFESSLKGVSASVIAQQSAAAEAKAIRRSEAYTTTAVNSLTDQYHRQLQRTYPTHLSIPGYAEATIPIALAGVIAQVATLAEQADLCTSPMCSDWNLAKDALASLGLTLGAAGAISFLVEAITNPVGTAGAVADIGLGLEETAVSTLANILGINIGGAGD